MSESQITNEVNQQFLRRTPVKLRQFARLLNDMLTQEIEPLRVKALFSQVNKTKDACVAQNFETTANLLNQLLKQLSMDESSLETQKPLLKRFANKLQEHSEKLELGVKPAKQPKAEAQPQQPETKSEPEVEPAEEASSAEESVDESLEEQGIYLDKGVLIFVSQHGQRFQALKEQFESLGIEVHETDDIEKARQYAIDHEGSVIVAPIKFAEKNEQLSDQDTEVRRIPLIFTAEEDTQQERLLALRSGGTAFMVEPVSLSGLLEIIERQYDIHADSPYRILIMEDSKAQARYYEKVLSKGHFEIRLVNDPTVLLEALRGFDPETILMDMQMPTCSGIELTRIIRQIPRFAYLPIIFLSAEENIRKQNQALLSGGTSFIVKPVEKEQLLFMAELYTRRYRELNPQIGENPDTGLMYAIAFKQRISVEAARMSRGGHSLALSIIQIDQTPDLIKGANFSAINVAIQQLSLILKKRLRKTDIIGHLETGQLGIILTTGKQSDWKTIFEEIRLQFAELPFHLKHHDIPLTVSIGLGNLSVNWDAHRWYDSTLTAMNKAIEAGGDSVVIGE
ncbi:response regulator [Aliikangiella marina]|uniref:Response regulator n=1 Tax=Aliikangiella marina TaxID=1712262 RepID=A0A545T107_9GAMM|nr:response regulator [Aliikangiella marina]TQV70898.1 response regulator [Aliikangiella marina]